MSSSAIVNTVASWGSYIDLPSKFRGASAQKDPLTKKQDKNRKRSKMARKSRKR